MANEKMPKINIADFTEIVKDQLEEENLRPLFALGKGGIGKSESMMELAKSLNIGYVDIRLLLYSETDLKGIPYPNAEHTRTNWLPNSILPSAEVNGDKGILVLDEITSASKSLRTAAYQLLQERKLGEYKLPDGWLVVCLGNGDEDGGDYEGMEGNFANRCSLFAIEVDTEAWLQWAKENGINDLVIQYIKHKPSNIHTYDDNADDNMLFASPRSWKAVSDILNKRGFSYTNTRLQSRILACIGPEVGYDFISYCETYASINIDDILDGKDQNRLDKASKVKTTIQSICSTLNREYNALEIVNNQCQITPQFYLRFLNGINWMLCQKTEYAVLGVKDLVNSNRGFSQLLLMPQTTDHIPNLKKFIAENSIVFS